jgi:hypothetical protein
VSYFRLQKAGKISPRTIQRFLNSTSRLSQNAGQVNLQSVPIPAVSFQGCSPVQALVIPSPPVAGRRAKEVCHSDRSRPLSPAHSFCARPAEWRDLLFLRFIRPRSLPRLRRIVSVARLHDQILLLGGQHNLVIARAFIFLRRVPQAVLIPQLFFNFRINLVHRFFL